MQSACSVACAIELGKKARAKSEAVKARQVRAEKKAERAADRVKRESMKKLSELIAEADKEFCAFIRERDRSAGHPCISSGRPLDWENNQVDGGHWRSKGAASHLRYNEDNCHAQSKHDNLYLSGNAAEYRIRLVERIGLERVEALESDNRVRKWTHDELRAIRDDYRARASKLKKYRQSA